MTLPLSPLVSVKVAILPFVPGISCWKMNYSRIKHSQFKTISSHRAAVPSLSQNSQRCSICICVSVVALGSVSKHQIQGMSFSFKPMLLAVDFPS